jgi:hypothetical protein
MDALIAERFSLVGEITTAADSLRVYRRHGR